MKKIVLLAACVAISTLYYSDQPNRVQSVEGGEQKVTEEQMLQADLDEAARLLKQNELIDTLVGQQIKLTDEILAGAAELSADK